MILKQNANRANAPPARPAIDTAFVRSRIGAPQLVAETFFVAGSLDALLDTES
jgi:hypothetical protein